MTTTDAVSSARVVVVAGAEVALLAVMRIGRRRTEEEKERFGKGTERTERGG